MNNIEQETKDSYLGKVESVRKIKQLLKENKVRQAKQCMQDMLLRNGNNTYLQEMWKQLSLVPDDFCESPSDLENRKTIYIPPYARKREALVKPCFFEEKKAYSCYSQWGQDIVADGFFRCNKPRTKRFVEAGAFDGLFISNTKRLFDIGWSGVCIEPVSSAYSRLEQLYQGTNVSCIQKAVSSKEGFVTITDAGAGSMLCNGDTNGPTQEVQSSGLTTILDELNIDDFDFLSIDVEGPDFEVLKTLDFSRFRPQLLVLEYPTVWPWRDNICSFMKDRDYSLWLDDIEPFFRANESIEPESRKIRYLRGDAIGKADDFIERRIPMDASYHQECVANAQGVTIEQRKTVLQTINPRWIEMISDSN